MRRFPVVLLDDEGVTTNRWIKEAAEAIMDRRTIEALPKIELHLHLDCSLSYDVARKLKPGLSGTEYQRDFIAPQKCEDLADFLSCTTSGIALMQTESGLRAVVQDLFQQLKRENLIYAEIRFAPLLHINQGLTPEAVVEIVADSVAQAVQTTGIKAGLILCTLRHYNQAQSTRTIRLVERYLQDNLVVGFDIASDEAGHPVDAHREAFEIAIGCGIPRTAHAGEAVGPESVWETLEVFKPHRIGHGVRSIEDPALVARLAKDQIHLEVCPSCNIQTNIFKTFADHPVNDLLEAGVSVGINTDARSLVNVSLTDEYLKLADFFGWGLDHFYQCSLNALDHAFIPDDERDLLRGVLDRGYGFSENEYSPIRPKGSSSQPKHR